MTKPEWLRIADELLAGPLFRAVHERLDKDRGSMSPVLALFHLTACLDASARSNQMGCHSVAVCLVRQCVESLALVDTGLQSPAFRDPLMAKWDDGSVTHGELRRALETEVWPRYGDGLWDESWAQFFSNLAKSVQPYAHYTPQLLGWQFSVVPGSDKQLFDRDGPAERQFLARIGPAAYDPIKASRITLLHALVLWALGNLLILNSEAGGTGQLGSAIQSLRTSLGSSNLLFKTKDWADEIAPHVFFRSDSWRDA